MHKLLNQIIILTLIVVPSSMGLDYWYRNHYAQDGYTYPKSVLPHPEIDEKYTIVKTGNSHAGNGLALEYFANAQTLDLSSAGQELRYDLAFLKQYHRQIADDALIIINVSPISFSQKRSTRESGLQYEYYGRISPLYIPYFEMGDYVQKELFPFLRAGYSIRDAYRKQVELGLTYGSELEKPSQKEAPKAETPPVAVKEKVTTLSYALPIKDAPLSPELGQDILEYVASRGTGKSDNVTRTINDIFNKWIVSDDFDPRYFDQNISDLETLIQYCLDHNWNPVLITIPVTRQLETALTQDYMEQYLFEPLSRTDTQGVVYYEFLRDDFLPTYVQYFDDADHLSLAGAKLFTLQLQLRLLENGYLEESEIGFNQMDFAQFLKVYR